MDLNVFAASVNLSPNQAIAEVQELAKEGFLRKVGGGYGLTEKGKNALKVWVQVPSEMAFHFYVGVDKPLGFSAQSLGEFYGLAKKLCSDTLDFHFYRGDFENWFRDVLGDGELVTELSSLKNKSPYGEDLRKALLRVIDEKYGVGDLL